VIRTLLTDLFGSMTVTCTSRRRATRTRPANPPRLPVRLDTPSLLRPAGVGAVLDRLGVSTVTVVGHSSGCAVATALAEQRPDVVADLALIDFGPSLAAKTPEKLLFRLLLTPVSRAATVAPANWGHDPQGRACRLHPTRGHPRCLH
jgi:pimeloyl-ACP methyl ester carboxylesterase